MAGVPNKLRRTVDMQIAEVKDTICDIAEASDEREKDLALVQSLREVEKLGDVIYILTKDCQVLRAERRNQQG